MKISRIRIYRPQRLNRTFNQSNYVVTVETDAGILGVGEGGTDSPLRVGRHRVTHSLLQPAFFGLRQYRPHTSPDHRDRSRRRAQADEELAATDLLHRPDIVLHARPSSGARQADGGLHAAAVAALPHESLMIRIGPSRCSSRAMPKPYSGPICDVSRP